MEDKAKEASRRHRKIAGRAALNIHICRRVSGRDLTHVIAQTCRLLGEEEEKEEEEEEKEETIPTKAARCAIHPAGDFFIC